MRIKFLLAVTADVASQLGGHLIHTPTGQRLFEEHLPAAGVHCLTKIHWPGFVQPFGERATLIVETQRNQ